MTSSTEPRTPGRSERPFGASWREARARAQTKALPHGAVVVSCSAPRGAGGLGRHLNEIVAALESSEQPAVCISGSTRNSATGSARRPPRHGAGVPYLNRVLSRSPVPVSPALRARAFMSEFDAYAAQRLPRAEHLVAFNGQALSQFRTAREAGYDSLSLVSANSHLRQVVRQHARAHDQYPLEGSWATQLLARNLAEYARADRIYVSSRYTRESFLERGFPNEMLCDFPLSPDPRYEPAGSRTSSGSFEIVYVGSLAVHKGVPLLIDAVARLPYADLKLTLIGGWGTRGMRRFIQRACAGDRRISVRPGDPLPHLRGANLCVHPAYEDGFAYAPAEALACGVPVIVSEDTGMKDLIDPGRTGLILQTGDCSALSAAIDAAYRGEAFAA